MVDFRFSDQFVIRPCEVARPYQPETGDSYFFRNPFSLLHVLPRGIGQEETGSKVPHFFLFDGCDWWSGWGSLCGSHRTEGFSRLFRTSDRALPLYSSFVLCELPAM